LRRSSHERQRRGRRSPSPSAWLATRLVCLNDPARSALKAGGREKTVELALTAKDNAARKFKAVFADADEILPNKYFYRYHLPTPAKDLLAKFWRLEKEAEEMLKGLAQ
jgi:hypothetical protein